MPSYQPVSLPRRNLIFLKKPLLKPMKRHLPRPHQPSSTSTIKSSGQTAKEYLRLPMELRRYHKIFNFNQDTVIEWSVRRVQKLLVTVRFEPYTSPIIGVICGRSRPRNCLYCSCLCEKLTKRGNAYQSPPLKCDHCQYYPESHAGRCIGRLKEKSGSLAYILRHLTVEEERLYSNDETAMDSYKYQCLLPLRFPLIEKVRQRFQAHPFGNDPRFDTFIQSRGFIACAGVNRYEGYQLMLTNTSSTVGPIIREEWLNWYHHHARLLASPQEYIGAKVPLPSRSSSYGARRLQYVVIENDRTGSKLLTASPWIHLGNDDKYIRLEVTSSPLGGHLLCLGQRLLGAPRIVRCVSRTGIQTAMLPLEEDKVAGGYPIATFGSAPLKHFDRNQNRGLYYVIREQGMEEVSETIPLNTDAKYLKIILSTD